MCYAAENTKPLMSGKGIIYWNLDWDILPKGVIYFAPLSGEELHSPHWDPVVLLQTGPAGTLYLKCTHTTERGDKVGPGLTCPAPSPSPLACQCCLLQPTCVVYATR